VSGIVALLSAMALIVTFIRRDPSWQESVVFVPAIIALYCSAIVRGYRVCLHRFEECARLIEKTLEKKA
jgi:hypothetical protein